MCCPKYLVRVAAEKALPFPPVNPNAETVAAMKAARRGELIKVGKPDKVLHNLNMETLPHGVCIASTADPLKKSHP